MVWLKNKGFLLLIHTSTLKIDQRDLYRVEERRVVNVFRLVVWPEVAGRLRIKLAKRCNGEEYWSIRVSERERERGFQNQNSKGKVIDAL